MTGKIELTIGGNCVAIRSAAIGGAQLGVLSRDPHRPADAVVILDASNDGAVAAERG